MTTYKTAELTGDKLDAAVAKAMGWWYGCPDMGAPMSILESDKVNPGGWPRVICVERDWKPSSNQAIASLLRMLHGLQISIERTPCSAYPGHTTVFVAAHLDGATGRCGNGENDCVERAICRCIVASKFGEEIDL